MGLQGHVLTGLGSNTGEPYRQPMSPHSGLEPERNKSTLPTKESTYLLPAKNYPAHPRHRNFRSQYVTGADYLAKECFDHHAQKNCISLLRTTGLSPR